MEAVVVVAVATGAEADVALMRLRHHAVADRFAVGCFCILFPSGLVSHRAYTCTSKPDTAADSCDVHIHTRSKVAIH